MWMLTINEIFGEYWCNLVAILNIIRGMLIWISRTSHSSANLVSVSARTSSLVPIVTCNKHFEVSVLLSIVVNWSWPQLAYPPLAPGHLISLDRSRAPAPRWARCTRTHRWRGWTLTGLRTPPPRPARSHSRRPDAPPAPPPATPPSRPGPGAGTWSSCSQPFVRPAKLKCLLKHISKLVWSNRFRTNWNCKK